MCKYNVEVGQGLEENVCIEFWGSLPLLSHWLHVPKSQVSWNPHILVALSSTEGDCQSHSMCHGLESAIRDSLCQSKAHLMCSVLNFHRSILATFQKLLILFFKPCPA